MRHNGPLRNGANRSTAIEVRTPSAPHAITVKKDGYEANERMIGGLDWSQPHGNSPAALKVNVKLRRTAPAPSAAPAAPKDNAEPAEDTGGPYIKEIKPDSP